MTRTRFTAEQINAILMSQKSVLATADVCREHGISSATYHKWKAMFGRLEVSDSPRQKSSGLSVFI